MASLLANGKQQYFTNGGLPLVGGKLYTYAAGTSTPKPTFTDAAGLNPNTDPIILDARGEAVVFWSGSYKIVLQDSLGNVIYTVDNVSETALGFRTSSNGSLIIPSGTTAQRDAAPFPGYFRYNVDLNCFEGRYAATWKSMVQSTNGVAVPDGGDIAVQVPLVSGTNIKTLNGNTLLGAGDLPIATGAMVLLSTTVPTAGQPFVNFLTSFSATYDNYIFEIEGVNGVSASTFQMQFAVAGVADSSAVYAQISWNGSATPTSGLMQVGGNADPAGRGYTGQITVKNVNSVSTTKAMSSSMVHQVTAGTTYSHVGISGAYDAANAITGCRLMLGGGVTNWQAVGKIKLYGIL